MLNESDLEIADQWIRDNVLDRGDYEFDDIEEEGDTAKYFFHRHADHASVVYLVTIKQGKLYQLADNEETEKWELIITKIR